MPIRYSGLIAEDVGEITTTTADVAGRATRRVVKYFESGRQPVMTEGDGEAKSPVIKVVRTTRVKKQRQ